MYRCDGLSLTEVLVSLVIVTSASLSLLQQQLHLSRYTHQINQHHVAVRQLDNASEQFIAHQLSKVEVSYQLLTRPTRYEVGEIVSTEVSPATELHLHWDDGSEQHDLKRLLVNE